MPIVVWKATQATLAEVATRRWFRAVFAVALLSLHLGAFAAFGQSRFGLPFNAAPFDAPAFKDPRTSQDASHWDRLIVSRWDAAHYINIGLRGHSYCPEEARRTGKAPASLAMQCDFAFYPGYSLLGYLGSLGGRLPIDYALFGISLFASFLAMFLWTAREMVETLGLRDTYLSLFLFNVFTTSFTVVTVQTEPLVLASAFGAFVLLSRQRPVLAALVAGLGTGVRVSGIATGAAFAAMLAVETWQSRPHPLHKWLSRLGLSVVAFWGILMMLGYHWILTGDPLRYFHAHAQAFGHSPSVAALLWPRAQWLLRSIEAPEHEGVWLAATCLWLALGHREALKKFTGPAQGYWYTLVAAVLAVSLLGSVSRSFIGMNRYVLLAIPMFFATAKLLSRRRLALAVWVAFCLWHYWNVSLCYYAGGPGRNTERACLTAKCMEGR